MGRREDKKEATRQDILSAAGFLFVKNGYEDTSVDDIAESANVAKGTFYYHFKSKDEVLIGLSIGYLKRMSKHVDERLAKNEPPLEILMWVLKKIAGDTESYKDLSRYFYIALCAHMDQGFDSQYRDDPATLPNIVKRIVEAAQKRGEIDAEADPVDMGILIAGVSHHAQLTWILRNEKRPLIEKVEEWIDVVLHGIVKS